MHLNRQSVRTTSRANNNHKQLISVAQNVKVENFTPSATIKITVTWIGYQI